MRVQSCDVSPQGDRITIALPEHAGELRKIELSFDEASGLAMTLPRLLSMALRRRFSDDSLRHVYALRGYKVECASDLRHLLVTLTADDGFDVAFAITLGAVPLFAQDLLTHRERLETSEPLLPN
ncbi:hypothetical protein AB4099_34400 [Bosea sp. 2KB_26]|uniref:hypothetical protein n=1 Tax=Bosea sp. 2KB_26 TaxID=3237475 RepID=UPI003F92EDA6